MSDRFDLLIFEDAQEQKERREKEAESRKNKLAKIEKTGYCEGFYGRCDSRKADWIQARTWYQWDIDEQPDEDPNRPLFFCHSCAEDYEYHWQEMWDMYYADKL